MTDNQLAIAIARRFIQRKEIKAIQYPNGYMPHREGKDGPYIPWSMEAVEQHLSGQASYGHYLIDDNDNCRLFAFDIDLTKAGSYPEKIDHTCFDNEDNFIGAGLMISPREAWRDRRHPCRNWLKWQMGFMAKSLAGAIKKELDIPVAAVYSGSKGVHVYGFTGEIPAAEARGGALLVVQSLGFLEPDRGQNMFHHKDQGLLGFPCVNIEVYPKQDTLENKFLGNLLRLPLGKNLKSDDPTFFLDFKPQIGSLVPHTDPLQVLRSGNAWI